MLKIFNYNNYFKYNVKFRGGFNAIYASKHSDQSRLTQTV